MEFDVLLPTAIFIVTVVTVLSHQKLEKNIKFVFEERKFRTRDAVLMVLAMGLTVTAMAFAPNEAIQILFIAAYSLSMFSFTYASLKKLYIAVLPPLVFILLYFFYWNLLTLNLFAVIFAVIITVYVSALFSWKTMWIFAILVTLMDVLQVFVTGFMGQYMGKGLELSLPVAVVLKTFPAGEWMGLGLGDWLLAGLLAIQTTLKHGRKAGILTAGTISIAMFVFEVWYLNTSFGGFPATVIVTAGWIVGLGITRLIRLKS